MIEKIEIMKFPKLVITALWKKIGLLTIGTCVSFVPELASCPRFGLDLVPASLQREEH